MRAVSGSHFDPAAYRRARFAPLPDAVDSTTLRRAAALGLALISLLCMFSAALRLTGEPSESATQDVHALQADALDPRRLPEALATADQDQAIRASINALMASNKGLGSSAVSISVNRDGYDLMNRNADSAMIPASSLKLVTAAAALELLGPQTRFETTAKSKTPDDSGTINGDLFIIGGGDPLLTTSQFAATLQPGTPTSSFDALADAIAQRRITRINGSIIGDDTRFDNQVSIPTWSPAYATSGQVGAISALNVNQGYVRFIGGRFPSPDPTKNSADLLKAALASRGIQVGGQSRAAKAPDGLEELGKVQSVTVQEAVSEMLTHSDNTTAEVLLKNIGFMTSQQGTTAAGAAAVTEFVKKISPHGNSFVAVDGSGLDRNDRASCDLLDDVLSHEKTRDAILQGLPRAGESGTLQDRMAGSAAIGKVQAKTGTLAEVSALTGWVKPENRQALRFCVMTNGALLEPSRRLEDAVAVALAQGLSGKSSEQFGTGIQRANR